MYWLNDQRHKDPQAFDTQVKAVCDTYAQAQVLHQAGTHIISCDEKTGIQALERLYPSKPMGPGNVERREFEYIRHGTQALIASFEVATGQIAHASIGPRRTEADFAEHIETLIQTDPAAHWIFVMDQLNTHKSEALVRLVARHLGIEADLGCKGHVGILQSQASRAAFLQMQSHRIRFVYTPKHTSWLNQIEIWFSILVRKLLRRGSFSSTEALKQAILDFITYFNWTMAKPFKWTYKGRPLQA